MSREIKFRQFYDGRMECAGFINVHGCEVFRGFPSVNRNKHPVMQYTGLKDVNGVEVYEGDILESSAYTCNLTVIYDEVLAGFYIEDKDGYLEMLCDFANSSEIIGNIHQNPELLK